MQSICRGVEEGLAKVCQHERRTEDEVRAQIVISLRVADGHCSVGSFAPVVFAASLTGSMAWCCSRLFAVRNVAVAVALDPRTSTRSLLRESTQPRSNELGRERLRHL